MEVGATEQLQRAAADYGDAARRAARCTVSFAPDRTTMPPLAWPLEITRS